MHFVSGLMTPGWSNGIHSDLAPMAGAPSSTTASLKKKGYIIYYIYEFPLLLLVDDTKHAQIIVYTINTINMYLLNIIKHYVHILCQ